MTFLQAIILGAVQGFTEFLPVSSSGHLVLVETLFALESADINFEIIVHLATLGAIIVFFFKDLLRIRLLELLQIALATLPAVIVALLFKDSIESLFSSPRIVGIALLFTAALNMLSFFALRFLKKNEELNFTRSILIGLAQAFALIPGISRSGSTVAIGLFSGLERQVAFRFSFLMAIPAILGALVLQIFDLQTTALSDFLSLTNLLAAGTAFITGLLSLKLLELVIKKAQFHWFAAYCVIVAIVSFILL